MRTGVSLLLLALALALVVQAAYAVDPSALQRGPAIGQPPSQQVPSPAIKDVPSQRLNVPAVMMGEQLTREQFKTLPDSTVIELNGSRTTAGDMRATIRQFELEARAKVQAAVPQAEAKFEAYRAKLLQEQKVKLQDAHAKARAGKWMSLQNFVWNAQIAADQADFVLK